MKALVFHGPGRRAWEDKPTADDPGRHGRHRPDHDVHDLRHRPPHPQGRRPRGDRRADPRPRGRGRRRGGGSGRDALPQGGRGPDLLRHRVRHVRVLPEGDVLALRDRRLDPRQHDRRDAGRVRPHPARRHEPLRAPARADEEAYTMLSDILPTGFECGVLNGQVKPGDTVAIVGAGPIGLAALLTAQFYSPAELVMIDLDPNRLDVARSFGATTRRRLDRRQGRRAGHGAHGRQGSRRGHRGRGRSRDVRHLPVDPRARRASRERRRPRQAGHAAPREALGPEHHPHHPPRRHGHDPDAPQGRRSPAASIPESS